MRILGREIKAKKLFALLMNNPVASSASVINKVRQKFFLDGFLKGKSMPPSTIVIETTYRCNLRCKTCWFYGSSGIYKNKKVEEGLGFEQLKKLADEVAWFKPYIYLTGGEPLINNSSFDFIRYAKRKGLIIGIVTNGTLLTRENAEKLVSAGLDFITISLDGPKKIQNEIRGVECFDDVVRGIGNIIDMKKKKRKKLPIITLNCTISNDNYKYLDEVVKIGERAEVDIVALQHPCFLLKRTIKAHHAVFKKKKKESRFKIIS
jgi:MoaA/NifB/PqqE/SkfB family radical SAM enzyme